MYGHPRNNGDYRRGRCSAEERNVNPPLLTARISNNDANIGRPGPHSIHGSIHARLTCRTYSGHSQQHRIEAGVRHFPSSFVRRRNSVTVFLPPIELHMGGQRAWEVYRYAISRDILSALMPRAAAAVRRGELDLETWFSRDLLQDNPQHMLLRALRFIFSRLEDYSRTGELDLFGAAVREIEDEPDRFDTVKYWATTIHALTVVLDDESGLGCSSQLLHPIVRFLEMLFVDVQNLLGHLPAVVLFEAFTNICQVTSQRDIDAVHRIWDDFDPEVQDELLRRLRRARGTTQQAHRMLEVLRNPHSRRLLRN